MKSWSLDEWRKYFGSANSDIFEIIEHAIIVAASDCPKEFRVRRDGIAEKLFSARLTRCVGCDHVDLAVGSDAKEKHDHDGHGHVEDDHHHERDEVEFAIEGASNESKVNGNEERDANLGSNLSFDEAEALSDELEEQSQYVGEIMRIRDVLRNRADESEAVILDSLRRLQLLELTVDCLKVTEIGKAVNPLRKHVSKDVRQLAKTLINCWKAVVDEWVKVTETTAIAVSEEGTCFVASEEATPDSLNPSTVHDDEEEEEGLPSPPLDEGAFFLTQAGSMELSQFFDGMDDIGNIRPGGPFSKNNGRKPSFDSHVVERKSQAPREVAVVNRDVKSQQQPKKNEAAVPVRPNKPVTADSAPGRLPKSNVQRKSNNMEPNRQQKIENNSITKRPLTGQLDKSMRSDDAAIQVKLEATKRKLQESYQQVEKAKRQRTIQVMEINEIPKQGVHRSQHFKPAHHNRNWANGGRR